MTDPTTHTGWALIFGSVFILCAYGLVRLTCSAWSERRATAELTMQEAAAAPLVAPFAHELTDGISEYYFADVLRMVEDVAVPSVSNVVPLQRDGRLS